MTDQPPCAHPYEGWFVNGVSIEKHGFLLAQFLETVPGRRGENVTIARRPGARFQPKYYEPRVQTLVVWALKEDEFGSLPGHDRNVDRLKRLLGGGLKTVEVTRRIQLPFGRVSTRTATVELVQALEGSRTALAGSGTYVQFAVDLLFHDPFWYEPRNLLAGQGGDYSTPFVVWNPGTVQHFDAVVRIYGPAVQPELTVGPTGSRIVVDLTIDPGDWVEIDSYHFTAVDQSGTSVAGSIIRDQVNFVELAPGRNEVALSDGTCDFSWRPAFL